MVLEVFEDYLNLLSESANSTIGDECKKLQSIVDLLKNHRLDDPPTKLEDFFAWYEKRVKFAVGLERVYQKLLDPKMQVDEMFDSNISSAYRINTSKTLQRLSSAYLKEKSNIEKYRQVDFTKLNIESYDFEKIRVMYQKHPYAYELYALLATKLDVSPSEIQGDIDVIFGRNHAPDTLHLSNPSFVQLFPATPLMTFDEIAAKIFDTEFRVEMWGHVGGGKDSFKNLAAINKACIIVAHHVTYHPVEHDISKLISAELAQSREMGVSKKMVERFKTITSLDDAPWNFSYEVHGTPTTHVIILETLDDQRYRILCPAGYSGPPSIPVAKVSSFLRMVMEKIPPSNEMSGYHMYCMRKAVSKMFMPHEITLEMPIPDSTHTIVANITKSITEFVSSKTKGSNTHRQILSVLHSSEIPSILTGAILSSIDVVSSEVTMSLIADVMAVSKRFTRELHDSYTKNSKKEFDPQLVNQAILRAVEIVFPDDNNVLESISKKQMMLAP